ncbi:MAG TPA: sulfatase [Opitutaceae bacterium]|nr:sulfatase [Opitutaceae bacterium]
MKTPLLCLLLSALLPALAWSAQGDRPNIVVFLIDDMGIMDTSLPFLTDSEGKPKRYPLNDYYRTPNMERLAARGVRFNQFCAMSVCSPTRISLMTGQNAARHRTTNWINPEKDNTGPQGAPDWNWLGLTPGAVSLPAILKEGGYQTLHIGKGHFGPNGTPGADPLSIGFQVNIAGAAFGAPGSYFAKNNFTRRGKGVANAVPHLVKYHGSDLFLTEALTLEAKAQLKEAAAEKRPFFLHLAHYAVHSPFESDPRFADHYAHSGKPAPAQAFATLVEGMDKSLGDLLDHLESLGIAENTLIFFLGDNGSDAPLGDPHAVASAAPLRGKKGSHYEGGMRVPFIAAWAKPNPAHPNQKRLPIPAGVIQTQQAAVMDLFPTILTLAQTPVPQGHVVDGKSLDTLLAGQRDPQREEAFLMHYPHAPHRSDYWTSYRDGAWKVIYHYLPTETTGNAHYQLFNLAADPFEQNDLSSKDPAQLKTMMKAMLAQLEQHQAVYPVAKDGTAIKPRLP